jgi:hypothetical protein
VQVTPSFKLQPNAGISYLIATLKLEDDQGDSITETEFEVGYDFGVSLIFKANRAGNFALSPAVSIVDREATFALTADFVFYTL